MQLDAQVLIDSVRDQVTQLAGLATANAVVRAAVAEAQLAAVTQEDS